MVLVGHPARVAAETPRTALWTKWSSTVRIRRRQGVRSAAGLLTQRAVALERGDAQTLTRVCFPPPSQGQANQPGRQTQSLFIWEEKKVSGISLCRNG